MKKVKIPILTDKGSWNPENVLTYSRHDRNRCQQGKAPELSLKYARGGIGRQAPWGRADYLIARFNETEKGQGYLREVTKEVLLQEGRGGKNLAAALIDLELKASRDPELEILN